MNTSFDDQASQSTTTDQQSETSSANPQSPRSTCVNKSNSNSNSNLNYPFNTSSNSLHLQQNYLCQEPYMYQHSSSGYQQAHDLRNFQHQHRTAAAAAAAGPTGPTNSTQIRRCYTGVDKLIMAAMLEESAAGASSNTSSSYMPSGRGIGYFGRDSYAQQIPTPSNKSEFELFRLLDRANLLNYFGTFLNFGGDDVQQLSDADEDEFLEIMSLVGMTQKPLHVRRLQKALIEWRENKETELNTFRRPPASQLTVIQSSPNASIDCGNQSGQITIDSSGPNQHKQQPQPAQSSPSTINVSHDTINQRGHQRYGPEAHEIIVGAPKRLRLMDNLHIRSITSNQQRSHQVNEDSRSVQQLNNNSTSGPSNQQLPTQPTSRPTATSNDDNNSIEQLPLSPSSQKSTDKDDDKLIEIMDSPRSDQELEQDDNMKQSVCESPESSAKFSHNKYGRYKASLRGSPNKVNT